MWTHPRAGCVGLRATIMFRPHPRRAHRAAAQRSASTERPLHGQPLDDQGPSMAGLRGLLPLLFPLVWLGSAGPLSARGAKRTALQENVIAACRPDTAEATR